MIWDVRSLISKGLLGVILLVRGRLYQANTKSGFEAVERRQDIELFAAQRKRAYSIKILICR